MIFFHFILWHAILFYFYWQKSVSSTSKISFYRLYINEALARFVIMASSIGELSSSRCVWLRLPCNAHRHSHTHFNQINWIFFFSVSNIFLFFIFFDSNFLSLIQSYICCMYPALCVFASLSISFVWTNDTDLKIRNTPIHFHFYFLCTFFPIQNTKQNCDNSKIFRNFLKSKHIKSSKESEKMKRFFFLKRKL